MLIVTMPDDVSPSVQKQSGSVISEALGVPCKIIPMSSGVCWIPDDALDAAKKKINDPAEDPGKVFNKYSQNKRDDRDHDLRNRELILKGLLAFGFGFLTAHFLHLK